MAGFLLGGAVFTLITYVMTRLSADREWERHVSELHHRYNRG
jgi:uncharacterized protein (DUF2062 family)